MNELPRITVPGGVHPWSTVYAMAHANIPESWLLVGGLMVQMHAMLGGLSVRPTTDADMLVDLISDRRGVSHLRTVLERRAFRVEPGTLTGYTTRMVASNGDVVDVLVADHLPKHLMGDATMGGGRVLPMPGGAQAIERSMEVQLVDGDESAVIRVPDLLGALMLKSAAWSVDHAGFGDRHLRDAAMLASLIQNPDAEVRRLHSRTDRKRLRVLHEQLAGNSEYWEGLDAEHRMNGLDALEILAAW